MLAQILKGSILNSTERVDELKFLSDKHLEQKEMFDIVHHGQEINAFDIWPFHTITA